MGKYCRLDLACLRPDDQPEFFLVMDLADTAKFFSTLDLDLKGVGDGRLRAVCLRRGQT